MDALIEYVWKGFPELEFEVESPPSYVSFYSRSPKDIVLVYMKNKQSSALYPAYHDVKTSKAKEELDLTGSPLKVDLSLHTLVDDTMILDEPQLWLREEILHSPIGVEKARKVANLFNELLQEHEQELTMPMWILCDPRTDGRPFLLTIQSYKDNFRRGIVGYEDCLPLQEIDVDSLIEKYAEQAMIAEDSVLAEFDCKFLLDGMSYDSSKTIEDLLNAPHGGATSLVCEWTGKSLQTPVITCKVNLEQEVIVGHLGSPCHSIWKSLCALHSINQLLVDMAAAGFAAIDLDNALIRKDHITIKPRDNKKRLTQLLNQVEMYTYTVKRQKGGFICITDTSTTLRQCLDALTNGGSSNDFTYRLWDILKDCETAEELITLLIHALKVISSGKMKPFIDANNKTYLAKLVVKLSRGHSQTGKVLKNFRTNPQQALSLVGQVGIEKTMWEYTHLMSLIEHSFFIAGIWTSEVTSNESIEQINQTIYDMTMGGECSLNPFENKSTAETTIRIDCDSSSDEDSNELNVDDFASLKRLGVTNGSKMTNEVPLIADEIDISSWKNLLMKFAQVHVCLEQLNRAQQCLKTDFESMKSMASKLREHYVSDKSSIKTVGQLVNEPVQKITMPIDNSLVKDHLKKSAFWYRAMLSTKAPSLESALHKEIMVTYAFTQQPVFPPSVWQCLDQPNLENVDSTMLAVDLKYYITKYVFISHQFASTMTSQ